MQSWVKCWVSTRLAVAGDNSLEPAIKQEEPEHCEICEQKFETKKDLRTHVLIHLGQPRVVLKRIANLKTARKEPAAAVAAVTSVNCQYWLDSREQRGNLKITLKRQSPVCDSLKLKLKKSPISEAFTVVSNNFDLEEKRPSPERHDALAEAHDNDGKSDSEEEKTTQQSFENVMLNQEVMELVPACFQNKLTQVLERVNLH